MHCAFIHYDAMSDDDSFKVKEFLIDAMLKRTYVFRTPPQGTYGKNVLLIFPLKYEWANFRVALAAMDISDEVVQTFAIDRPTERVMVACTPTDGIQVYTQPGDTVDTVTYSSGERLRDYGYYADDLPNNSRYFGKIVKLWIAGSSHAVWKTKKALRHELRHNTAGTDSWGIDSAILKCIPKLGKHAKIYVMSERGDVYTIDVNGVFVNQIAGDDDYIKLIAYNYVAHGVNAPDAIFRNDPHGLNPYAAAMRKASHIATLNRHDRGYI